MAEKGAAEEQQLLRDLGSEIPVQFQGWILVFATITGIWLLCLPCFCAGLSCACARKCGSKMLEQLPIFLLLAVALEAGVLVLLISWLPDWTLSDYVKALARFLSMVLTLLQLAPSVVMIVAACVVVSFKDRILMMLGLDHKALFRWKLFDCCCCFGGSRYRAVELSIWKLTELETGVFSGNNVFVEVSLGFNESMRTRVHNNAGTDCLMKETLQLNFDESDDDETLYIFVRSQKVVGASDLGRVEVTRKELKRMLDQGDRGGRRGEFSDWDEEAFEYLELIPRGKIFLRVLPIVDDD